MILCFFGECKIQGNKNNTKFSKNQKIKISKNILKIQLKFKIFNNSMKILLLFLVYNCNDSSDELTKSNEFDAN